MQNLARNESCCQCREEILMKMPCGRVAESVGKTLNSQRRSDAISEVIDHLLAEFALRLWREINDT